MKKLVACLLLIVCMASLAAGCRMQYYHEESSATLSVESIEDSVPPYVVGEKGFYDTAADVEYLLVSDIRAKSRGKELFAIDGRTFYQVAGVGETFLIADGSGNVYRNASIDWIDAPGEPGWAEAYPALEWLGNAD